MTSKKTFTKEEAEEVAKTLNINWEEVKFDVEQFRHGMDIELEHGSIDSNTNVTNDMI